MPSDTKGKGLTKKVGGQPVWAWGAEIGGGVLLFLWWRSRQAANAANAQTALSTLGADTAGAAGGGTSSSSTSPNIPSGGFLNVSDWLSAVLAGIGGGQYNAFVAYLNGNCISSNAGVAAIQQAIQQFGLPPGFGTPPPITVCPSSSSPPPPAHTSSNPPVPPGGILSQFRLIQTPALEQDLLHQGFNIFNFGNAQYYLPTQSRSPGHASYYQWIPNPQLAQEYAQAGRHIISFGGAEYVLV